MNPVAAMRMTARTATAAMMDMVMSEGFSVEQKKTKKTMTMQTEQVEKEYFHPSIY